MEDEIKQLKSQVQDLIREVDKLRNESQANSSQLNSVLGFNGLPHQLETALIERGFLKYDGDVTFTGGASDQQSNYIFAKFGVYRALIYVDYDFSQFTVNTSTDVFYSTNHPFSDEQQVLLLTTDTLPGGLSGAISYYITNADANTYQLIAGPSQTVTSVNTGTEQITTENTYFVDDDVVKISSTGSVPGGLNSNSEYYVVNASGATFQLSDSQGGSAKNITSSGSGTITVRYAPVDVTSVGTGTHYALFFT